MSAESLVLLASIFSLSFLGSWHCGLMCGAFSVSITSGGQKAKLFGYHAGRFLSYVSLGALSGYLGFLFSFSDHKLARIGALLLLLILASGFFYYLYKIFEKENHSQWFQERFKKWIPFRFDYHFKRLLMSLYRRPFSSFLFGLLSIVLPCGWLYGYVFAASATQSSYSGALVMFAFWLGGLPILTVIPVYFHSSLRRIPPKAHTVFKALIFAAALFSWVGFYWG